MRASRDDRYQRKPQTPAWHGWVVPMLFGSAVTAGALYLAVAKFGLQVPGLEQPVVVQPVIPEPAVDSSTPAKQQVPAERNVDGAREKFRHSAQRAQPRQREFNDTNYTPRGADNVYRAPPVQALGYTPGAASAAPSSRVTHSANWSWDEASRKRRVSGVFQWVEVDGRIQWGSVCQNYRSGSFDYRDCRKGAKLAFRQMCGHYRPACMAENGFRP